MFLVPPCHMDRVSEAVPVASTPATKQIKPVKTRSFFDILNLNISDNSFKKTSQITFYTYDTFSVDILYFANNYNHRSLSGYFFFK
jgi:hypothetical protein